MSRALIELDYRGQKKTAMCAMVNSMIHRIDIIIHLNDFGSHIYSMFTLCGLRCAIYAHSNILYFRLVFYGLLMSFTKKVSFFNWAN